MLMGIFFLETNTKEGKNISKEKYMFILKKTTHISTLIVADVCNLIKAFYLHLVLNKHLNMYSTLIYAFIFLCLNFIKNECR